MISARLFEKWEWIREPFDDKVSAMNVSLTTATLFFAFCRFAFSQTATPPPDCSTLKYLRHKVSCLCGTVQICSGDICGNPSSYNLDDDITVELRDKGGMTILDSKKVVNETRETKCTTQVGMKVPCNTRERRFCFEGKHDGNYQLAFILFKNGVPQPAIKFPTNYSRKRRKLCDSVYMVEPTCPK